ncbi:hypothetical protein BCR36DRAFT_580545 [Piromyces finnis]|uniref:Uncharacterized protein n=1 Tax=Piromyces finnis TaxID=1754191 RepID=A0A1Y1VIA8_9FUNG|nr:hypothetical protein BCR36DRAFT_580545 [Piromyces finnis]|eukprot:ORX57134.1 hypothetical protein BCR36DRAFT_580545 [Piromyces finnis]
MDFDKDYNREEKINLAKKKLKKFRKYHNVSSSEPSRESLNSNSSQSQTFSIPGTPNVNNNINQLSPTSYQINNNMAVNTQNNNFSNSIINNNISPISDSTTTNSNINNTVNLTQSFNTNNSTQIPPPPMAGATVTDTSNTTTQYTYPISTNNTTTNNSAIYSSESTTNNNTAVEYNNYSSQNNNYSQSNYYSTPNAYSFQSSNQNSYYPMDNTGNTYSLDSSNASLRSDEKKQTGTKPSIRSGISGFVGSMFKNIIEAAAPPINPEYLQKYKSSQNSSLNSLNDDDNGMGNNYLVSNNSNINYNNTNNEMNMNYQGATTQTELAKNEEPEYMKNISNNSGVSTPLFIQNSNMMNSQAPPPTSAIAPSQYVRSMPKKKKKWASFQYNEGEIVVDRENYSKNPANNISLKDYLDQQQQNQKSTETTKPMDNTNSSEYSKTNAVPPKATVDALTTNMFVPEPPKVENTSIVSPTNSSVANNTSFLLSPNDSSNVNSLEVPPMAGTPGISATPTPPPPMAGTPGISATPTPPPPMAGTPGVSTTPIPPPPMAGTPGVSTTPIPPPPMAGTPGVSTTPIPPPPMAGTPGVSVTPTPPPKTSNYSGFSIPTPNNGFSIPSPSNPMSNNDTGNLFNTTTNQMNALSSASNQVYNTATVILDEKEEPSIENSNENYTKIPSVVGIIEENDNILLSSPHIDYSNLKNGDNNKNISKYTSNTSFTSLVSNPEVIELTSNSNSTTLADKLEGNDVANQFNSVNNDSSINDDNAGFVKPSNDVSNENLSDVLLNNHYKGKKKSKKTYSMPLSDIMASPFGVHPKVANKENTDNKLSEVASLDLGPLAIENNKNDSYSETVSPDDTSSIFGVPRNSKETNESSSLSQYFVSNNDISDQSPVVVEQNQTNDSLLFSSNEDGTNNNTNIMTEMKNTDDSDNPFNLIDDLENVGISDSNRVKKVPFNKETSLVSPDKINEMSDIPLDENVPEKSTRQFFASKILSETAKAKNLLSGMFPIKDNKSEGSVSNKLANLAFSSHSETNELASSDLDNNKSDEAKKDSILELSNNLKSEQNVLFTGSPENNDNQSLFIDQPDENNNSNPLFVNTEDTPKQEILFATPTEQRKTNVLYGTNMGSTSSLFDSNDQKTNQQQNEFISYIGQDNNGTEFPVQSSQDNSNQGNTNPLNKIQNEVNEVEVNNIPFFSSENNVQDNNVSLFTSDNNYGNNVVQDSGIPFFSSDGSNVQNNSIPFFTSDNNNVNDKVQDNNIPLFTSENNNVNDKVQDNNIPFLASDNINADFGVNTQNDNIPFYTLNDNNTLYNQNNNTLLSTNDNINPITQANDIYNQNSPAKFYISSGNATPISNDMYNNNTTFPISNNTSSPIKNEISNDIPIYGSETISTVKNEVSQPIYDTLNNESNVQNETVPFFTNNNNESLNNGEAFSYYNSENNNSLAINNENQQNNSIPFFSTNTAGEGINEVQQQPVNIFDSLSYQNNTNVNFFDNQNNNNNNGANWFEQFSQSNEQLVPSNEAQVENSKQEDQQKPSEIQELKFNEEENTNEKQILSTVDQSQNIIEGESIENPEKQIFSEIDQGIIEDKPIEKQVILEGNQSSLVNESIINNDINEPKENISEDTNENINTANVKLVDNTELLKLQDELNETNKLLKEQSSIISDLNSQIDQQKEQNNKLNDNIEDLERINNENKEKIKQYEKTIDQLNSLIKAKDQQIELLKEETDGDSGNKSNSSEINRINDLLSEKIAIIEQLTNEKNNLIIDNDNQKQLLVSTETEAKEYQSTIKQLNEEIKRITNSSGSTEEKINNLQDLLSKKEKQYNEISEEKESIKIESQKKLDDINNLYKQLEDNYNTLQEETKKYKEENASLEQEVTLMRNNAEKSNEDKKEENEFIQKIKEIYPDLAYSEIINKISCLNNEKEVVQPNPVVSSKTNNIQELNWNEMSNTGNNDTENDYIKDNDLNVFTPQPFLQMNDEQVKKYENENNDLKQKCNEYEETMKKDKAEIEYLKDIIKNQKITQLPQLALNDDNGENHSLIEIIDQLTKDNQALSLQVQELRHEVDSNNQANTSIAYSISPFENINSSNNFPYPTYLDSTQQPNDLMYNQLYNSNGNIHEQPDYDMNYYDTSRLSNFAASTTTYDHQQLLNQLDEREKNERNKMLASTSMGQSQTDLLYMQKYNPYSY